MGYAQQHQFQRNLGGSKDENSYALRQTPDGGFISVGYTESFGSGKKDVHLVKTDGLGQIEWAKAYGDSGDDIGWNITVANDSGYVITGTTNSYNKGNEDALIFKVDKDGKMEWTRTIDSDSVEDGYNVISSFFGSGYYVTGFVRNDSTGDDGFIAKLSASGTVRWYKKFGSPGNEEAYGLAEDLKGNVIICGMTTYDSITQGGLKGSSGTSDAFLAKFDSIGDFKWMKTIGSTENDVAWDVKVDKNNYVMVGWTRAISAVGNDMLFISTDTSGTVKNSTVFSTTGDDRAFNIVVQPNNSGNYALTGYADPMGNNRDVVFADFSANGQLGNFTLLGGSNRDGHWPTGIVTTKDGGYAMLSTSNSFGNSSGDDWYLIKTTSKGASNCNTNNEVLQSTNVNFNSVSFGSVTIGTSVGNPVVNTTTISSLSDTTLCCALSADLPKTSVSICEGKSVRIGVVDIPGVEYTWTDDKNNKVSTEANPSVSPSVTTTYKLVVSSKDGKCTKDSSTVKVTVNARLNEDFVSDTSFCSGDSATLIASKNLVAYTWLGKTINSNAKSITVKQHDTIYFNGSDVNSCTYNDTMIVTVHSLPEFNLGNDTTVCEVAGITLSGPAGMTSYDWNNGDFTTQNITVNVSRNYKLAVVDVNKCKYEDDLQLFVNPSSPFSLGADDTFCEGGEFTILGPGALGGYIWNDTASTLQNLKVTNPGTYHLTAYNSFNCPSHDTIVLVTRNKPVFDLGPAVGLCIGSSRWIAGPKDMTTYKWNTNSSNDSIRVTASGKYWLKVTDLYTCSYTDTIEVNDVANPVISLRSDTTICIGDSVLLTPGSGFAAYSWNTTSTSESIYAKNAGQYEVTVTDDNGCKGSASMKLDTMTCINDGIENLKFNALQYYPVPAKDNLHLTFEASTPDHLDIKVVDITGKTVYAASNRVFVGVNELEIEVSELTAGTYFVWLNNSNGTASLKILVE